MHEIVEFTPQRNFKSYDYHWFLIILRIYQKIKPYIFAL